MTATQFYLICNNLSAIMSANQNLSNKPSIASERTPNVGIASRLINEESSNKGSSSLSNTQFQQDCMNYQHCNQIFGFSPGFPVYAVPRPGSFVLPHHTGPIARSNGHPCELGCFYGEQALLLGNPRLPSAAFYQPQYYSVGLRDEDRSSFRYPLHHLTSFPPVLPFSEIVRPQFVVAHGSRQLLQSDGQSSALPPVSAETSGVCSAPKVASVQPAFIFDEPDDDHPEDLSVSKNSEVVTDDHPAAESHHGELQPHFNMDRNASKIDMVCDEWRQKSPASDVDGWDILQDFEKQKRTFDYLNIHIRSEISKLPLKYRSLASGSASGTFLNTTMLHYLKFERKLPEQTCDDEPILEAEDVDHQKLLSLASELIRKHEPVDIPNSFDESEADIFAAVGLAPATLTNSQPESTIQTRTRRKRKLCADTIDSGSPRSLLIQQLNIVSTQMTSDIKKLKEQLSHINRIKDKERLSTDDQIPNLAAELETVLMGPQ